MDESTNLVSSELILVCNISQMPNVEQNGLKKNSGILEAFHCYNNIDKNLRHKL